MTAETLVSIVTPCYNAEKYIADTLRSVQSQSWTAWELIIVNDGSTDQSHEVILPFLADPRIHYYRQANAGVSAARNHGLEKARGSHVLFLDADDLLERSFLEKRLRFLEQHPQYTACSSLIQVINGAGEPQDEQVFRGVHDDVLKQILSYDQGYSTCPSAYLFLKSSITGQGILFNKNLSSPADKFFLIEYCQHGRIGILGDNADARLLYRIHDRNMSLGVSVGLLNDNRRFMHEVLALSYIPRRYKRLLKFKMYYILSGGYFKLRNFPLACSFALRAFIIHPLTFIKQLCVA